MTKHKFHPAPEVPEPVIDVPEPEPVIVRDLAYWKDRPAPKGGIFKRWPPVTPEDVELANAQAAANEVDDAWRAKSDDERDATVGQGKFSK